MRFVLPLPPSINATYKGARGRLVYTDVAAAYVQEHGLRLNQRDCVPLEGDVTVTLFVYMAWKHKGDMHNHHKLILDILQGHAYKSDQQIVELLIYRRYDKKDPHILVVVEGK